MKDLDKLWNEAITYNDHERFLELRELSKTLQSKLWCLMEAHKDECCYYEPTGCIHPIKETELCECPCELYWHPKYSDPISQDCAELRREP